MKISRSIRPVRRIIELPCPMGISVSVVVCCPRQSLEYSVETLKERIIGSKWIGGSYTSSLSWKICRVRGASEGDTSIWRSIRMAADTWTVAHVLKLVVIAICPGIMVEELTGW
jgi:hypothetical protein